MLTKSRSERTKKVSPRTSWSKSSGRVHRSCLFMPRLMRASFSNGTDTAAKAEGQEGHRLFSLPLISPTEKSWPDISTEAAMMILLQLNTSLRLLWALGKSKWNLSHDEVNNCDCQYLHPTTGFPLVSLRKSLITVYLSSSSEYNAFLFDSGVMRTNSWCLGITSCDTGNRHRKVCVGHWTHSILLTLESKNAFKSKHHWLNSILSEWQPVNFLA